MNALKQELLEILSALLEKDVPKTIVDDVFEFSKAEGQCHFCGHEMHMHEENAKARAHLRPHQLCHGVFRQGLLLLVCGLLWSARPRTLVPNMPDMVPLENGLMRRGVLYYVR